MADVKKEDFVNYNEPATTMQLLDSTSTSYDRLCVSLLSVFRVFDVPSQELFEALEASGDDISRHVGRAM